MDTPKPSFDVNHVATRTLMVVLIVGWLALAAWAAAVLLMVASLSVATFFGDLPTRDDWVEGVGFSLAAVGVAAAGPLGVWLFHRKRGWLIAAGYTAMITVASAVYLLFVFGAG